MKPFASLNTSMFTSALSMVSSAKNETSTGSHLTSSSSSSSSSSETSAPSPALAPLAAAATTDGTRCRRDSLVPSHWEDSVRYVGVGECRAAGLSLAHSFAADDLSKYLLDADDMAHHSPETRWKLHVLIMEGIVASHCLRGAVGTIGPDYDAVALWELPHKETSGMWTLLRSGLWRLFYKLSREGRRRYYSELLPTLHDTKAEVMGDRDGDCYYLVYIGTKLGSRGRGYAAKLISDMIAKADAEQRAIYLESSSPANTTYYAKFGFELRRDIWLGTGEDVMLSIMVREPRSQSAMKV